MGLAGRSLRNMDTGVEQIEDAEILAQVRRQARKVNILSLVWSIVLTIIVVLIPL